MMSFIQDWVSCFDEMTSDRGAQFMSGLWCLITRLLDAELHHMSTYHPQSNGLVEPFHLTLGAFLRSHFRGSSWTDKLPWVLLRLCTTHKADSPHSPAELTLRLVPLLPSELIHQGALSSLPPPTLNMNPLQSPYRGPFHVTTHMDSTFTLLIEGCPLAVNIDCLKPSILTWNSC